MSRADAELVRSPGSLVVLLLVSAVACGDDPSNGFDPSSSSGENDASGPDGGGAGHADAGGSDDAATDTGCPQDPPFSPGAPPDGDPELQIMAARDPANPNAVSSVRHGDVLIWECGTQSANIGHIWANFRLQTPELDTLSEADRDRIDARLEIIDRCQILADHEGLFGAFDFSEPGALSLRDAGTKMILNRGEGEIPANTRPSFEDGKIVRFRVVVELPNGRRFVREAWVDTLVPSPSEDSSARC